jgi:hypothetical protein
VTAAYSGPEQASAKHARCLNSSTIDDKGKEGATAACFRYIINDVNGAIEFYTRHLGFKVIPLRDLLKSLVGTCISI